MTTESIPQQPEIHDPTLLQSEAKTSTSSRLSIVWNTLSQNRRILSILTLQVLIILFMLLTVNGYADLHGIQDALVMGSKNPNFESFPEQIASFNFIGTTHENSTPSFFSVWVEVFVWSLLAVMARELYYLTTVAVSNKELEFLKAVSKIVGETAMGVAIAIAVLSFLRAAQLTIGNVDLTLKSANIELIGALAFILGFYHEDTRRLLASFRGQVTKTDSTDQEPDDKES